MITQIEIDGFKSFKDFKVELAPFQVIVGPNGSGKSNLFDALQLLSHAVDIRPDADLYSMLLELRGGEDELFMKLPEGKVSNHICLAIEMLIDRKTLMTTRHIYAPYIRLRYELEIMQALHAEAPDQLYVARESLSVVPQQEDSWCKKYKIDVSPIDQTAVNQGKTIVLFSLNQKEDKAELVVQKQYMEVKGNKGSFHYKIEEKDSNLNKIDYTIMSRFTDFLTGDALSSAQAAREELYSLRFLHLNPEVLRQPSSTKAPRTLSFDGSNLPTVVARMQAEDKYIIGDISRDMANLVPGILKIRVVRDKLTDRYAIQAKTSDQRTFSSQVLSDGTLRLLALATLKNDPRFHGVLCIEEPENGIDPLHLKNMVDLLCAMATDFSDPEQVEKPLRQVIVTSHSPTFISLPEVINSLIFAFKATRVEPQKNTFQVTRMVPIPAPNQSTEINADEENDIAVETYTIDQVKKYLESARFDAALELLGRIRGNL